MTSRLEGRKIPTDVRVSYGIIHSFAWGLVGLVVSCTAIKGDFNATLTGAGLAGAAGFAYGMASVTEKDVDKHQHIQEQIQEESRLTALVNRPRRLVPVERLSHEQRNNLNLLVRALDVWDDVIKTASRVPRIAAGTYVLELQKIRREVAYLDWSESFTLVRNALIAYMDCVIKKFHDFQADRIGWRWNGEIAERRKYIELALEQVGVMEPY